jgi:hypothetical protein
MERGDMKRIKVILTIALIISAVNVQAVSLKERIPYARYLPSAIDPFYGGYGTPFDTYEEAIRAIEEWNAVYPEREREFLAALEDWRAECERLRADAYSRAVVVEYGEEPYEPVRVYSEDLGIWIDGWREVKRRTVTKLPSDYKLPRAPEFDGTGYREAESAYCYLISDGLTAGEWLELRVVILHIDDIKNDSYIPDERIEGKIDALVCKGYMIITEKGNEKYDVEYSNEGYYYFTKLIKRSREFRKGLITSAYDNGEITEGEFDSLIEANDKIKEELIKQLDKKKDWYWETGGTYWVGDYTKLPGGLLEAYKLFDVDSTVRSTGGQFPYNRVLDNIPVPKDIERLEGSLYTTEPFPDE